MSSAITRIPALGITTEYVVYNNWWLRTPGRQPSTSSYGEDYYYSGIHFAYIDSDGGIVIEGYVDSLGIHDPNIYPRPAMWINFTDVEPYISYKPVSVDVLAYSYVDDGEGDMARGERDILRQVNFTGQQPIIVDGHILVPVTEIGYALDLIGEYYDPRAYTIRLDYWNPYRHWSSMFTIELTRGSYSVKVDSTYHYLDSPVQFIGGSLMMPLDVLKVAGFTIEWDENLHHVLIHEK